MSASWVAGSVRAKSLGLRRLGRGAARSIAASHSLEQALETLTASPYGRDVRPGMSLADAQRMIGAVALWNLRVLAGWLPRSGTGILGTVAGWWELLNVDQHLAILRGATLAPPFELGALATAWPRIGATTTPAEVRSALAASAWGDPGSDSAPEILLWLRLRWAERLAESVPGAFAWATGLLTLLVAREVAAGRRTMSQPRRWPVALLGTGWQTASTLAELGVSVPREAAWVLDGITEGEGLWRGETRWWNRVEMDGLDMLRHFQPGRRELVVGATALILVDAWRTQAALEVAARGGRPLEVFDALA